MNALCCEVTSASDAELLARVATGELSALATLYDRHAAHLLRFATRVAAQDAEDLLQTVFLRLVHLASRFDGRNTSARGWLFAILTRVAQERTRSLRRFARALARVSELPRVRPVVAADARADIHRALQRLSTAKRTVLILAEVEGFTGEEIATMLNIPIGTVWTRLHHARKEVRELIAEPTLPVCSHRPTRGTLRARSNDTNDANRPRNRDSTSECRVLPRLQCS